MDTTNGDVSNANATLQPGDVNDDNVCDVDDLGLLALAFNTVSGDMLWNTNADLNSDDQVDVDDLGLLALNFNTEGDP